MCAGSIQMTRRSSRDRLPLAKQFLTTNGRLLDRLRFSFLFEDGSARAVHRALQAYENDDGGYGHALEPDLRGPESEPIPGWTALGILDEIDAVRGPALSRLLDYFRRSEVKGGGVPFVLRAAARSPHAPWWETGPGPVHGSLNPTAGLVAYLEKHRVRDPWVDSATAWCWNRIDRLDTVDPYQLRVVLAFLDHTSDRARAGQTLTRLRPSIRKPEVVELDSRKQSDAFRPLDFAPHPSLPSRTLFSDAEVEGDLDRIERAQRPDGGWGVSFPIWTPITRFEWEGVQTVEMLKLLKAYGRLGRRR